MDVNVYISSLVQYGLDKKLIEVCDTIYVTNQLLDVMKLDCYTPVEPKAISLEDILQGLLADAVARNVCDDDITSRDLFDTKLMGILTPPPREVHQKFSVLYGQSPETGTNWYYNFSQDTDYIRRYRIQKDVRWKTATDYGNLPLPDVKTLREIGNQLLLSRLMNAKVCSVVVQNALRPKAGRTL